MDKEKFEKYTQYLNTLEGLGIISSSTYLYLSNEAYQKLKSDEKLDAYCNYHILRSVIKLKSKFDMSYWATSPEISPDAPESISSIRSMDVPETPQKPAEAKSEPLSIKSNAAKVRWARLRGLKSNRPEKYCFVKIAEYD